MVINVSHYCCIHSIYISSPDFTVAFHEILTIIETGISICN
jgi:hypothetical protein